MSSAPPPIILSGIVHHNKPLVARPGDVAIFPAANGTKIIDGYVHDEKQWRALDLDSFLVGNRRFNSLDEVGPLMRHIESILKRYEGSSVRYLHAESGKRRYVRGGF